MLPLSNREKSCVGSLQRIWIYSKRRDEKNRRFVSLNVKEEQ
jgi:hypothetical protein